LNAGISTRSFMVIFYFNVHTLSTVNGEWGMKNEGRGAVPVKND